MFTSPACMTFYGAFVTAIAVPVDAGLGDIETAEGLLRGGLTIDTAAGDGNGLPTVLGVRGVEGVVGVVGAEPDDVEFGIMSFKITCLDPDGDVNKGLCPDLAAAVIIVCRNCETLVYMAGPRCPYSFSNCSGLS